MGEALTELIEKLEVKGGVPLTLQLTSPAFSQGSAIPRKYTCDGDDISPELNWTSPKTGTQSFALILEDPDAPGGNWVHWVIFNIPATQRSLPEEISTEANLPNGIIQGVTDFRKTGYGGPCPPSGVHRYYFKLYALDATLSLPARATRNDVLNAVKNHVLETAELMGTYSRQKEKDHAKD